MAEPVASASVQSGGASPLGRLGDTRFPLEVSLKINGKFLGTISIAVDRAGNGEIDARRLIALIGPVADPKIVAAVAARIAGRPKVDFRELDVPGFTIRFDSAALEVEATLAADASLPSTLRLGQQQDVPVPSAFDQPEKFATGLNIAAGQRYIYGHGFERVHVDLQGIANVGGFDGVTFTGGSTFDGDHWQRREFRLTHDDYDQAIRYVAGEFTPVSVSFQGSGRVLGLGVERSYSSIRPFQNTRPIGRQQFTLEHASNVDVYVNQIRVQTLRLAAGRYDIGDFPFAAGPNQVQLVVEDVGGRREIIDFSVFNTTTLLNPGITEFGGAIGLPERDQFRYSHTPAATGHYLRGVSDNMTLGFDGQATRHAAQIGGVIAIGTRIGYFQFEPAASRSFEGAGFGTAAILNYRGNFSILSRDDLRVAGSMIYRSRYFQDAFSGPLNNTRALDAAFQVQWLTPFAVSTGIGGAYTLAREGLPNSYRIDVNVGRSFGRIGISATGSRSVFSDGRGNDTRVAIGISVRLGRRDNADMRFDSGTRRKEVEFSRAPDGRLDEISGAVRYTDERDGNALSARLAYVNNRFDLVLNQNRLEQTGTGGRALNESDWNIRTFVGYAGGSFGIGRAVDEGFVIAPVHRSLEGAQASIVQGDRVIARSGLFGPAVIPIGRAYGIGRYDFKVDPLPLGYDLGEGGVRIFPGYGSGYRAMIGSDASHIAVGFLVGSAGPVALMAGTVVPVEPARLKVWKERAFFTNRAGRFVVDRLAPGRYRLMLGGHAMGEFQVKPGAQGLVDVGTIHAPH